VPGALLFSLRLLVEALLAPLRAARRLLGGRAPAREDRYEAPAPRARPARTAPRRRRAEPTRGQVAAMREAAREDETGGADSIGAQMRVAEPWPGYDGMRLDDLLARLQGATEVELAVVRAYEREHEARQAVLLAAGETV
jgi:hypothetical protein